MTCTHHPDVQDQLAPCVRCARAICPSCQVLVGGLLYCGRCKEQLVRDLRSGRAATGLAIASPGRRFVAIFIDGILLAIPLYALIFLGLGLMVALGAQDSFESAFTGLFFTAGQFVLIAFSLGGTFLYEWLMISRFGYTLGKRAMRLKVVTPQGHPVSRGQAAGRAGIKQVFGFLSCLGLVDYIPAFFTPEATAVHDMVASSRVIDWEGDEA